jgi:hypothetical protein
MRNCRIYHLQKLVSVLRVLIHYVLGFVDHLNQAILFTTHSVILCLNFDIHIRIKSGFCVFVILVSIFISILINWNHFKNDMVKNVWLNLSNFTQRETSLILHYFIKVLVNGFIFGLFLQIDHIFDHLIIANSFRNNVVWFNSSLWLTIGT